MKGNECKPNIIYMLVFIYVYKWACLCAHISFYKCLCLIWKAWNETRLDTHRSILWPAHRFYAHTHTHSHSNDIGEAHFNSSVGFSSISQYYCICLSVHATIYPWTNRDVYQSAFRDSASHVPENPLSLAFMTAQYIIRFDVFIARAAILICSSGWVSKW